METFSLCTFCFLFFNAFSNRIAVSKYSTFSFKPNLITFNVASLLFNIYSLLVIQVNFSFNTDQVTDVRSNTVAVSTASSVKGISGT